MTIEALMLQAMACTTTIMLALCYLENKFKKNAKGA